VFEKLRKATIGFDMSVCLFALLHGTTGLTLDGFSRHLISEHFSKMCRENSCFTYIWQE